MNTTILENMELIRRFWSKVDVRTSLECWNWKASTQSKGYGSFGVSAGRTQLAHRIAYMLEVGDIPEGLLVRHKCDNRLCCNPKHLELGTIADNNHDSVMRGRNAKGERSGRAKLMDKEIVQIREDYKNGILTVRELASLYQVHPITIKRIGKNEYRGLPLVN